LVLLVFLEQPGQQEHLVHKDHKDQVVQLAHP
jgi:hypothetical protein